mmetsp:Transcript_13302/g.31588  ORF Transcript_13302/g.31588 Transcript_13302/m.31588 type:complete len:422 (-) Transcript_13302:119-1384(-)
MASQVSMSDASNTVAVHFQSGECPRNLEEATILFSKFGDIARLDTTLGTLTGLIFATFFDVRAAQKVLQHYGMCAESFQAAAYDFRALSISTSAFAELPAQFAGFHSFGEIAGVSVDGEDIVVEFYDLRAAQQVAFCVPGSRPKRSASPSAAKPPAMENHFVSGSDWVKETMTSLAASLPTGADPLQMGSDPLMGSQIGGDLPKTAAMWQGPGKPVREKVRSQDLSKFDIVADKIRSGEDSRTTVMVRNIPKACSREAFVELLVPCGLGDRYTFFYMPFDKRRNIHCGFAFINFRAPSDVLVLCERMTPSFWRAYLNRGHLTAATMPAVSYARLQGQDQLTKHFSLSAVMRDSDARKRPVFCSKTGGQKVFLEEELEETHEDEDKYAPCYISTTGVQELKLQDLCVGPESIAFMMKGGCGA